MTKRKPQRPTDVVAVSPCVTRNVHNTQLGIYRLCLTYQVRLRDGKRRFYTLTWASHRKNKNNGFSCARQLPGHHSVLTQEVKDLLPMRDVPEPGPVIEVLMQCIPDDVTAMLVRSKMSA